MNLETAILEFHGKKLCDLTPAELSEFLGSIAERGANNALATVGLNDDKALSDMKDLRDLLGGYRIIKKGALQQVGKVIVWVIVLCVITIIYNSGTTKEIVKAIAPIIPPSN
jgi:Family of unknown function (DUF6127)